MRDFAGSQFGEGLWGTAFGGNPRYREHKPHRRRDISIVAPTGALGAGLSGHDAGQRHRCPAMNRDLPELAAAEEADPLPVGREKRVVAALGAGQQRGFGLTEQARRELLPPVGAARRKGQPATVGRDGDSSACAGYRRGGDPC